METNSKQPSKVLMLLFLGFAALLFVSLCSCDDKKAKINKELISQSEALVTCLNYYKAQGKY